MQCRSRRGGGTNGEGVSNVDISEKEKSKLDPVERFLALTNAQKDAEVARFEKPLPLGPDGLPGKPLSSAHRKRWNKIQKRLRGRPMVGDGAKVLAVSVDADRRRKPTHSPGGISSSARRWLPRDCCW